VLPRLRRMATSSSVAWRRAVEARAVRAWRFEDRVPDRVLLSSEVIDALDTPDASRGLWRRLTSLVEVTEWAPLVGALPAGADAVGPPPLLFGVTGLWR